MREAEAAIATHLTRWRAAISTATPTNVEMAELGINQIFKLVRKKPPDAILWCDSPYQLAVIPPMVTNVLQSPAWSKLTQELNAIGEPASDQWETHWRAGWQRLRGGLIEYLAQQILDHEMLRPQAACVRENALRKLERHLRQIALENQVKPPKLPPPKNDKGLYHAKLSTEFFKSIVAVGTKVEQAAGIRIGFNVYTIVAPFVGVFDERIVGAMIPQTEPLTPKPREFAPGVKELLNSTRAKCWELEQHSLRMMTWLLSAAHQPRRQAFRSNDNIRNAVAPNRSNLDRMRDVFNVLADTHAESQRRTQEERVNPNVAYSFPLWMPFGAPWLPFATAAMFVEPDIFSEVKEELEAWSLMAHGALAYGFADGICYPCRRPLSLEVGWNRVAHNPTSPVAEWADGFEVYSWRGIQVDRDWIVDRNSLTASMITHARNAELRRVMIEIFGESRYLVEAGARQIHEDAYGTLFRLDLPGDEALVMVRVKNSTPEPDGTYKFYFLRVPPTMERAKQAVAWTFDIAERRYHPTEET